MTYSTVKQGNFLFVILYNVSLHVLVHLLAAVSPYAQATVLLEYTVAGVGNVIL